MLDLLLWRDSTAPVTIETDESVVKETQKFIDRGQADRGFAAVSICNIHIMKSYYVTYVLCIILCILKRTHHHEVLPFRRFAILS